jgi:hypothetical protein
MKVTNLKYWGWSSIFLAVLISGLLIFVLREAKKDTVGMRSKNSRIPASIPKTADLTQLQGESLVLAAKMKILTQMTIDTQTPGIAAVRLGNFVQMNAQNETDFACGVYNHITLSFAAEGVAVSGERPILIVDSPCTVSGDINTLEPVAVPFDQIKAQSTRNHDFTLQNQGRSLHIQSLNSPEAWPTKWSLTDITMTHDLDPSRVLHISPDDIRRNLNKPLFMNW